jgi:hypothetical protein
MPMRTAVSPRALMIAGALRKPAAAEALSSERRPNPIEILVCICDISRDGLSCPLIPCNRPYERLV